MATRLVVFDCDGTLVDSQHAIIASMRTAFAAYRLAAPSDNDIRRIVGLPLVQAVTLLLPADEPADPEAVAAAYRDAFFALRTDGPAGEAPFPGIVEVLAGLDADGYLLAVATGKSRRGLTAVLDAHDIAGHFVTLKTADDGPGKPHPQILLDAIAEAGAEPASTIMIGDTTYDIEMAVRANALSIGVAWGYHDPAELTAAGAGEIAGQVGDLPRLIEQQYRGYP